MAGSNWPGVALALALGLTGGSARASVKTVELASKCGLKVERANGFIARDWRPGQSGLLIVTALHAVHGCREIKVQQCGRATPTSKTLMPVTDVLTWPALDVAAIPIAAAVANLIPGDVASLALDAGTPDAERSLNIRGASKFVRCGVHGVRVMETTTVEDNANLIAERYMTETPFVEAERTARGSLDRDARIIRYNGPGAPGLSGGAVVDGQGSAVYGIHHAGFPGSEVVWAIAFSGMRDRLRSPQMAKPGGVWPPFVRPSLGQANSLDDLSDEAYGRFARRRVGWTLSGYGMGESAYLGGGSLAYGASGALLLGFERWKSRDRHRALALVLGGYGRYGSLEREVRAPDDTVVEDGARRGSSAWAAIVGLELRLARTSRWHGSSGVALRGGFTATRDLRPADGHRFGLLFAAEAYGQIEWAIFEDDLWNVGLRIAVGPEWAATGEYRTMTVPEEDATYRGGDWRLLAAAGLGVIRSF